MVSSLYKIKDGKETGPAAYCTQKVIKYILEGHSFDKTVNPNRNTVVKPLQIRIESVSTIQS